MLRSWKARRSSSKTSSTTGSGTIAGKGGLLPLHDGPRFVYPPKQMRAVTLVVDATQDLGLVWGHRGPHVVLTKLSSGLGKLHPALKTGLHLLAVNNQSVEYDVHRARDLCVQVYPGEPLTLLLWAPPTAGALPAKHRPNAPAASTTMPLSQQAQPPHRYVTATIYKEHADSKTGLTLQTAPQKKDGVRLARLSPPAPYGTLRVGMRLLAIEQSTWFVRHSEAVPLIRSLPAGYCTFLFAADPNHPRSNSMDAASVATSTIHTDEMSGSLFTDMSRRSHETGSIAAEGCSSDVSSVPEEQESSKKKEESTVAAVSTAEEKPSAPTPTTRLVTITLTPDMAQQVILMDDDDNDLVYLHSPVAHLQAGWQMESINGQSLASAGHYEHVLQTTEEDVTLVVRAPHRDTEQGATKLVTATAVRPSLETKTGLVLKSGDKDGVVLVSRVTPDSLFPTLAAGMQILSVNGLDWFTTYQEAIGLIRSLQGEITIVAQQL